MGLFQYIESQAISFLIGVKSSVKSLRISCFKFHFSGMPGPPQCQWEYLNSKLKCRQCLRTVELRLAAEATGPKDLISISVTRTGCYSSYCQAGDNREGPRVRVGPAAAARPRYWQSAPVITYQAAFPVKSASSANAEDSVSVGLGLCEPEYAPYLRGRVRVDHRDWHPLAFRAFCSAASLSDD